MSKPSSSPLVYDHDPGTFLCQSRSDKENFYLVDGTGPNWTCTCDGFSYREGKKPDYQCWHIRYILRLLGEANESALSENAAACAEGRSQP